eukprot:COSAG06_NODE_20906_length_777_cov_0.796460_2_plen_106_part_00
MSATAPAEYSGDSDGESSETFVCELSGAYCDLADSDLGAIYDTVNFIADARSGGLTKGVREWVKGYIAGELGCSSQGAICGSSSAVGAPTAGALAVIVSCLAALL